MAEGVKISQLTPWNGGFTLLSTDMFEVARDGVSYKIPATTLGAAIVKSLEDTLGKFALKDNTVGYPAVKSTLTPKWKVTDSSLFEELYANTAFIRNTQLDGVLNNTRSFFYSKDFEREHSGFSIWKSAAGWNLECDLLYVRKAIKAKEYLIESISALKGTMVLSAANGQIKYVEEAFIDNKEVYKITFEDEVLSYKKGDIILCQTYGDRTNVASQKRYIAVIQDVTDDGKVILNKSDFVTEAGFSIQTIPTAGDETVQYGNISDVDRQGLIQLSAAYNIDGSGSKPYISIITDINGRYGTNTSVDSLIQGAISTAGNTRSVFGHLKEIPYKTPDLSIQPNTGFGVLTDNGLFSGRVVTTEGNIVDLLTVGGTIDSNWNISGGTCGLYGGTQYSEKKFNSTTAPVRFFCGGNYQSAQNGTSSVIIKEDGSGVLAKGNISWDDVGNTKIVGELSIVTPSGAKDLLQYIDGIKGELQTQIDKAVESWFYPFDPADNRPPVTLWLEEYTSSGRPLANILKQHINDTFTNVWDGSGGVDPNTGIAKGGTPGASWRWTLKSSTAGDNISDYQWTRITDTVLTEVLSQLAEAFKQIGNANSNAESKVTTYVTSYPEHNKNGIGADQPPLNYKKGDMWYNIPTTSIKVSSATNAGYSINDWNSVVDHSLDYLKDVFQQAFNNETKILGGLISTTALRLGGYQTSSGGVDAWIEQAGISGMNPTKADAIRAWFGGTLASNDTTNAPIYFRANGTGKVGRMEVTTDALKFWGADATTPLLEVNASSSTLVLNGSGTFTGVINATGGKFTGTINASSADFSEFNLKTGKVGPFFVYNDGTRTELIATDDGMEPMPNSMEGFHLRGGGWATLGWHLKKMDDLIEVHIAEDESGAHSKILNVIADGATKIPIFAQQKTIPTADTIMGGQTFAGVFLGHVYTRGTCQMGGKYYGSNLTDTIEIPAACPDVVLMSTEASRPLVFKYNKPINVDPGGTLGDDYTRIITFVNIGSYNVTVNGSLNGSGWRVYKYGSTVIPNLTIAPGQCMQMLFRFRWGDAYVLNMRNWW